MKLNIKIAVEGMYGNSSEAKHIRELDLTARLPTHPTSTGNIDGLDKMSADQLQDLERIVQDEVSHVLGEVLDDIAVYRERAVARERKAQHEREAAEQAERVEAGAPVGG